MNRTVQELLGESRHDFDSLVSVMALLRAPGGCPWDREQTHESIRANFIEETYEVIEAIDTADPILLREELGDVLLQVVFHACISEEEGAFCIGDVIHDITEKLIRRHPHIFADVKADTSDAVLTNWEKIKTEEKHRVGLTGSLTAVPPSLPALMRAQKLMKKAGKAGILPDKDELSEQIRITGDALSEAVLSGNAEMIARQSGRLAFLTAAAAQGAEVDVEEVLSRESTRFAKTLIDQEEKNGNIFDTIHEKKCNLAQNAYFL